eukprot:scaffold649687_cov38-Prasinocladus_malaysianus.AAC.1
MAESEINASPIRIKVDYQISSDTPQEAESHLKNTLVPKMVATLRQFIQVDYFTINQSSNNLGTFDDDHDNHYYDVILTAS